MHNWVEIDLHQMRHDGIYGNNLYEFMEDVGTYEEDWVISPMLMLSADAPFKIYFKASAMAMGFYLKYCDYVSAYETNEEYDV